MIVGNGDIASILRDREGAIFFAAGVSNSRETSESEYNREISLLKSQDRNKCLFYLKSSNNKYHLKAFQCKTY